MQSGGIKVSPKGIDAFRHISSIDVVKGGALDSTQKGRGFAVDNRAASFRGLTASRGINASRFASTAPAKSKVGGDSPRARALAEALLNGREGAIGALALALEQSYKA